MGSWNEKDVEPEILDGQAAGTRNRLMFTLTMEIWELFVFTA